MGKVVKPLRRQVTVSFYKILIISVVATVITWGLCLIGLSVYAGKINPANYYENKIPEIMEYVAVEHEQLLDEKAKAELEKRIPLEGLDYQILDAHGNWLYGSVSKQYIKDEQDLLQQLNGNLHDSKNIIHFEPIFGGKGNFIGAIGFRYQLRVTAPNPGLQAVITFISILALASPFLYFSLFSYLTGKNLSKQMEKPFQALVEGARKIQHHDLEFQLIEFKTVKELQELVNAFEEMRIALKESLLRQWQMEEEWKEMVAALAHDLRTPLTIIQGHAEGLMMGGWNKRERLERYVQTIYTNTERAVQLLEQLRTVSLVEHPTFTIEKSSINIYKFLQEKADEFQVLCRQKHISFTMNKEEISADQVIIMDGQRISQVLDNIVTNSIRYCPEKGEIEWLAVRDKGEIIFTIMDNGPGFHIRDFDKVFVKFYRGDSARDGTNAQSGLGLFIAQEIIKKHGGRITVGNRPEGGAYVNVQIPV